MDTFMAQHFLLSAESRTLSLKDIYKGGEEKAYATFKRLRWSETNGEHVSNRRAKAIRRAARLSAKRARIRRDWHHKVSRNIANRFGTVVLEDLRVKNMTASAKGTIEEPGRMVRQKAGLNRSILNQGWSAFAALLDYKLSERGGYLVRYSPMRFEQGVVRPIAARLPRTHGFQLRNFFVPCRQIAQIAPELIQREADAE